MTLAFVYEPGVTEVLARLIVPVVVIAPPVKPVPVATDETVPLHGVTHCSPEAEAELAVKLSLIHI